MRLYGQYFRIHLKSVMTYRASFLLMTMGQFLVSFNVFLGVFFMFKRFNQVEGFNYAECLLCFSIVLLAFSIAECFFRGFDTFPQILRNGEFDRMLVRPQNAILQVLGAKMAFSRVGRFIQAVLMLIFALNQKIVQWDGVKVLCLVLMIVGGVLLFGGLYILFAGICFFTLDGLELMNIFTDGAREYGKYPLAVYGKQVLRFATFIVPYALFQYYPLLYLLGRTERVSAVFLPLFTSLFLIPVIFVWQWGLKNYQSNGS